MPIYILDINPEEIKLTNDFENEIFGLKYHNPNYDTIVEKVQQAVLSHVKKIDDIDELLSDYQSWTHGELFSEYLQFRGFLQSKLADTQEEKK